MVSKRFISITILFLVAFVFVTSTVSAAEISNASLRLVVHENSGRFSLYSTDNGQIPLFVAEDPTTTYISLLANERIYILGNSFAFRQNVTSTGSSITIEWKSSRLEILQTMTLKDDTLAIDIRIENVSEISFDAGIRYIFDTSLGEDAIHFRTDSSEISRERSFSGDYPDYILSGTADEGLYFVLSDSGFDTPDRIVVANWKRLDDTSWSYTVNTNRNFNLRPYSINDSAIAFYYEPQRLAAGNARSISLLLTPEMESDTAQSAGTTTSGSSRSSTGSTDTSRLPPGASGGITAQESSSSGSDASERPQDTESPKTETIRSDLKTVDELIESIDAMLEEDGPLTESELADLKKALELLQENKEQYEQ